MSRPINVHKCRRCETLVFFSLYLKTGKTNPLEYMAAGDGNCRVSDYHLSPFTTYEVLTGDALAAAQDEGETLFISHFARCAFARSHAKRKKELSPREILFGDVNE